jgi:hypothetical protein
VSLLAQLGDHTAADPAGPADDDELHGCLPLP